MVEPVVGVNQVKVTLLPGVVVAKDWIQRLHVALETAHGFTNPDFSWDKTISQLPSEWRVKFFAHTGKVGLRDFIGMICEVADVIALPPLPMTVGRGTSPGVQEFSVHWKGNVHSPEWPPELMFRYHIVYDAEGCSATFVLRDIADTDVELAQRALQQAVQT